jgi:hypothetical protein
VVNLLRHFEHYLAQNHDLYLKEAPRRQTDLRVFEAVFHFSLYTYLVNFFQTRHGRVQPEFPTGNGKINLLVEYAGRLYGIEVKSFTDAYGYQESLRQARYYAQQLGLDQLWLAFFVEAIDKANRQKFEAAYTDLATGITIQPVFVATGAKTT